MKKIVLAASLLMVGAFGLKAQTLVQSFDDIEFWTGSGANRSALLIQWRDQKIPGALVWGFQWSSSTTLDTMINTLASRNLGLYARIDSEGGYGRGYFGFGFDTGFDGSFGVSGAEDPIGNPASLTFTSGVSDGNAGPSYEAPLSSTSAGPTNPADRYQEGWWNNGYWELFSAQDGVSPTWTSNWTGGSQTIANNTWYAYSLTEAEGASIPPDLSAAVNAVPEPSVAILVTIALVFFMLRQRRNA
jgi:hypothetical protein